MTSVTASAGGVVLRGYLERCNSPPVLNFISWVSPQAGQFGVPNQPEWSSSVAELFDCCVYDELLQESFSFANYWKGETPLLWMLTPVVDPFNLAAYSEYCTYLPDINNERLVTLCCLMVTQSLRGTKNSTYKNNILNLQNFVALYSEVDEVYLDQVSVYREDRH